MSLAFAKYEGLGNDFVVVDAGGEADVDSDLARALCDRRRGIGGDGVLVMLPARARGAVARMRVLNADGSIPEMCGNGLRCATLHLALARGLHRGELAIETDAGVRACAFERYGARADEAFVVADMGIVHAGADVSVDVDGERVTLTRADAGNPHAVALREVTPEDFARLGPRLATTSEFERGANVEFARMVDDVLDVIVWERGVGPTLACGTGACAAVAVACAKGLVPRGAPVRVRLPGGELEVRHDAETGRTSMRGPARRVFGGTIPRGA